MHVTLSTQTYARALSACALKIGRHCCVRLVTIPPSITQRPSDLAAYQPVADRPVGTAAKFQIGPWAL
jgi:hypothetical protein